MTAQKVYRKYRQVAPRYVLGSRDKKHLRFQGTGQVGRGHSSQIHDISSSGISFTVPEYITPHIGGRIGLEFAIPGANQIACMGQVARVTELPGLSQNRLSKMYRVGVAFINMPPPYQKLLSSSLTAVFHTFNFQYNKPKTKTVLFFGDHTAGEILVPAFKIMLYFLIAGAILFGLSKINTQGDSPSWAENFAKKATGGK